MNIFFCRNILDREIKQYRLKFIYENIFVRLLEIMDFTDCLDFQIVTELHSCLIILAFVF